MTTKEKIGTVVSNKMDKTIVITVEDKYSHPLYGKTLKQTKRFIPPQPRMLCFSIYLYQSP